MSEFKQVRENLLDMLEDIDERLSKITDNTHTSGESSTDDVVEQSNEKENNKDSMRREINDIKQAISQIDSGTYGICLSCGQAIKRDYSKATLLSSYCSHCVDNKD